MPETGKARKGDRHYRLLMLTAALAGLWLTCSPGAVSCPKPDQYSKMEHLLVESDHDRTLEIRLGDTAKIALHENATTGYRWSIEHYDKELFTELATEPQYKSGLVGSGGEIMFIFQGKKTGTGDIMLKQWRSWEGDSSVIGRFHIRIHVMP